MKTLLFKAYNSRNKTLRRLTIQVGPFLGFAFGISKTAIETRYTLLLLCFSVDIDIKNN